MTNPLRATCVLMIAFDADLGLLTAAPDMALREKSLSVGRYGATRGLHRVLDVLSHHGVPATWFLPTANLERYPQQAAAIRAAVDQEGHELACAGADLTDLTGRSLAEQTACILQARDRLADWSGTVPVGYRICGEPHPELPDSLHDNGFDWTSGLRGDDRPYRHPGGLVEIPRHHELDDEAYFRFNLDPAMPVGSPRIAPIADVYDNWMIEFEVHRAEGLCFSLDLHTDLIGTPARAAMLSDVLGNLRAVGDVPIITAGQAAAGTPTTELPADHPLQVFRRCRSQALR